jgi:hypothetical protein
VSSATSDGVSGIGGRRCGRLGFPGQRGPDESVLLGLIEAGLFDSMEFRIFHSKTQDKEIVLDPGTLPNLSTIRSFSLS